MKKIILGLVCLSALGTMTVPTEAQAHGPVFYNRGFGRLYTGWGWYALNGVGNLPLYGYSYYPYFNYGERYSTFGAIAYSPSTGRTGWSFNNTDQATALYSSVQYCGQPDCAATVWVQGGCAAIATSASGGTLTWGYDADRNNARVRALTACGSNGWGDCQVKAWVCSY